MAMIGYARVSTRGAPTDAQSGALYEAGCTTVYLDHAHGALDALPQLATALRDLRQGDTLAVTRLDRLARSVTDLKKITDQLHARRVELRAIDQNIDTATEDGRCFLRHLAVIADFQHDRNVENTHVGLAAGRARGRKGGRKPKMTPDMITQARAMYDTHQHPIAVIAQTFSVAPSTIYRHLAPVPHHDHQPST